MTIDTGLLHNLETEFRTDDKDALIAELYEARSMLLQEVTSLLTEKSDLRADYLAEFGRHKESIQFLGEAAGRAAAERDAVRCELDAVRAGNQQLLSLMEHYSRLVSQAVAERDRARAAIAELVKLWDSYEMTAALPFDVRERAEAQAIDLETERDEAQSLAIARGLGWGNARAWSAAWKRAAKEARGIIEVLGEDRQRLLDLVESYARLTSRAIGARNRLKRACLAWYNAAQEAQKAQTSGPRDAATSALVDAATWARDTVEAYLLLGMMDRPSDNELLGVLRAALHPFARVSVPVVGRIEADEALGNRVEWGGGER